MRWLNNLEIVFLHNDLMSTKAEAIVCPVSSDLHEYGKISQKLFRNCQASFTNDLAEVRKKLPNGHLLLGQATSIECKPAYLIGDFRILVFVALWAHQSDYNFNLFYKSYINSLREEFRHGI